MRVRVLTRPSTCEYGELLAARIAAAGHEVVEVAVGEGAEVTDYGVYHPRSTPRDAVRGLLACLPGLRLPRTRLDWATPSVDAEIRLGCEPSLSDLRVLLLGDSPPLLARLEAGLTAAGVDVSVRFGLPPSRKLLHDDAPMLLRDLVRHVLLSEGLAGGLPERREESEPSDRIMVLVPDPSLIAEPLSGRFPVHVRTDDELALDLCNRLEAGGFRTTIEEVAFAEEEARFSLRTGPFSFRRPGRPAGRIDGIVTSWLRDMGVDEAAHPLEKRTDEAFEEAPGSDEPRAEVAVPIGAFRRSALRPYAPGHPSRYRVIVAGEDPADPEIAALGEAVAGAGFPVRLAGFDEFPGEDLEGKGFSIQVGSACVVRAVKRLHDIVSEAMARSGARHVFELETEHEPFVPIAGADELIVIYPARAWRDGSLVAKRSAASPFLPRFLLARRSSAPAAAGPSVALATLLAAPAVAEAEPVDLVAVGDGVFRIADVELPLEAERHPLAPDPRAYRHVCLDQLTAEMLRSVALAVLLEEPFLAEGDTACGKTTAIEFIAAHLGVPVSRINLSAGDSDSSNLVGRFVPDGGGGFRFQPGLVPEAMVRGHFLVLDEMNLADTGVVERISSVFDTPPMLVMLEHDNAVIGGPGAPIHPRFRRFATQNAGYAGRAPLSEAWINRWRARRSVARPAETEHRQLLELLVRGRQPDVRIDGRLYRGGSAEPVLGNLGRVEGIDGLLERLARFHCSVENATRAGETGARAIGGHRRDGYVFSRRDLLSTARYVSRMLEAGTSAPAEVLLRRALVRYYLDPVEPRDRAAVLGLMEAVGLVPERAVA